MKLAAPQASSPLGSQADLGLACYRKLLEVISEFAKVAGCKVNTQKSLAFLCTNKERAEREITEIPLTITSKGIKYLGINLLKEAKDILRKL